MADDKTNTPMGGNVPEESMGRAETLSNRNVWAIDVLIEEVTATFQTEVETSTPNWLNANTVVVFSPTVLEWEDMSIVMALISDDERFEFVKIDNAAGTITAHIVANAVLYDTRDFFGVADAAVGLDREIRPDDLTPLAAGASSIDEGFTEDTDAEGRL